MIPYFRLASNKKELKALTQILSDKNWAEGNSIDEVKAQLSALFLKKFVVLTSNGFSALFVSLKVLKLKNEKIIIPCISTCFAINNAVIASGNIPVFCDVSLEDGNCSKEYVAELVKKQNIKYIISPNYAGNISDTTYYKEKLNLIVIEDACQSFFSSIYIKSKADMQILSFYPTKGINGIDGGAILTDNKKIAALANECVSYTNQTKFDIMEHYNFKFLNINAHVLLANLTRIDKIVGKLNSVRTSYEPFLKKIKGAKILTNPQTKIAQRVVVFFKDPSLKKSALEKFKEKKISLSEFYCWVSPEQENKRFINAKILINNCFCIPYFEDLTNKEIITITKTLGHAFS